MSALCGSKMARLCILAIMYAQSDFHFAKKGYQIMDIAVELNITRFIVKL